MILTGRAIEEARSRGDITIEPFDPTFLNPNSYNYRLADSIIEISSFDPYRAVGPSLIGPGGYLLKPGRLYLASTLELLGSSVFVITLLGRSSLGRLGLFLNISADLGHAGACSHWTLELKVVQPLRVYAGMRIGQVSFWRQQGDRVPYRGRYHGDLTAQPSRDPTLSRIQAEQR